MTEDVSESQTDYRDSWVDDEGSSRLLVAELRASGGLQNDGVGKYGNLENGGGLASVQNGEARRARAKNVTSNVWLTIILAYLKAASWLGTTYEGPPIHLRRAPDQP